MNLRRGHAIVGGGFQGGTAVGRRRRRRALRRRGVREELERRDPVPGGRGAPPDVVGRVVLHPVAREDPRRGGILLWWSPRSPTTKNSDKFKKIQRDGSRIRDLEMARRARTFAVAAVVVVVDVGDEVAGLGHLHRLPDRRRRHHHRRVAACKQIESRPCQKPNQTQPKTPTPARTHEAPSEAVSPIRP